MHGYASDVFRYIACVILTA